MKRYFVTSLVAAFGFTMILMAQGCAAEDDGGPGGADITDLGSRDLGSDTSGVDVTNDPVVTQDPTTDTGTPDYTAPVCGGSGQQCCEGYACDPELVCTDGTCLAPFMSSCPGSPACFEPPVGTPDVPINQVAGASPTMAGGALPRGEFELVGIDLYLDDTFDDLLVSGVSVSSRGNSYGSLKIEDVDWGFNASLDMSLNISTMIGDFPQDVVQAVEAGGCFTLSGNTISGDLTECGGVWPDGVTPPESLTFAAVTGGLELLLILPKEVILAAVPEGDRAMAELAITGDLPILFAFDQN